MTGIGAPDRHRSYRSSTDPVRGDFGRSCASAVAAGESNESTAAKNSMARVKFGIRISSFVLLMQLFLPVAAGNTTIRAAEIRGRQRARGATTADPRRECCLWPPLEGFREIGAAESRRATSPSNPT